MNNTKPMRPTPERMKKAGDNVEVFTPEENEHWRAVRIHDSPLSKLAIAAFKNPAKGISGEQFQAGLRFYADAYAAGMIPSKAMDMTRIRVDCEGFKDIPERKIAAMTRYNHALKALDKDKHHILSWVVIQETDLNSYAAANFPEFKQHREQRAIALNKLREALSQLDAHYYPKAKSAGMVSAMMEGARPTVGQEQIG